MALFKRAFATRPQDEELRRLLLSSLRQGFAYAQHEWPSGILYGINGAAIAECEEIALEAALARELDQKAEHAAFLDEFENRLRQYQKRLRSSG